eukprot:3630397-Rhodomonas_salina.1
MGKETLSATWTPSEKEQKLRLRHSSPPEIQSSLNCPKIPTLLPLTTKLFFAMSTERVQTASPPARHGEWFSRSSTPSLRCTSLSCSTPMPPARAAAMFLTIKTPADALSELPCETLMPPPTPTSAPCGNFTPSNVPHWLLSKVDRIMVAELACKLSPPPRSHATLYLIRTLSIASVLRSASAPPPWRPASQSEKFEEEI